MVSLDQFYTKEQVALELYTELKNKINIDDYQVHLEPSAGKGAFFKLLPEKTRLGLDLEPKYKGIKKQDFLTYNHEPNKKYIVIGNPPFGKCSSLAIKFFNYSATFADCIAFIIPITFNRISIQNKLNLNFHLIYNKEIPIGTCFVPSMSAKCCFQIWIKKDTKRKQIKLPTTCEDFSFINYIQPLTTQVADFALLAYGGKCGRIVETDLDKLRPKSWHFIKSNIDVNVLKERFSTLDYSISQQSVRQNSLGKAELIDLYTKKF
jgi:hypothetical protein